MNVVKVIRVRRWKFIPFLEKTVYVPIFGGIDTGQCTPEFSTYDGAARFISQLETCCEPITTHPKSG